MLFNKQIYMVAKGAFTMMLLFTLTGIAKAQKTDTTVTIVESSSKHRVISNSFWDNWFAGVGAGTQILFADHSKQMKLKDRFNFAPDVYVGKWFSPSVGTRLAVTGGSLKGVSGWSGHSAANPNVNYGNYMGFIVRPHVDVNGKFLYGEVYGKEESGAYDLYKTLETYTHIRADVLFNANNILGEYKKDRFYALIPYAGVGWMFSNNADISGKKAKEVGATLGLMNSFRLSDAIDLNLDLRGVYTNERFNGQIGNRKGDGILSGTIGIAYKFKKRGWDKASSTVIRITDDNNFYKEKIAELETENLSLRDKLGTNTKGETIIDNKLVAAPQLIVFPIDTWFLTKEAKVNIGFLARIMKEMNAQAPANYIITGYADKGTGTPARNEVLSRERARVVKEALINEFGVPAQILKTRHEGGVGNMFYADPRLSRCAIVTAE